jgi:type VI protein secretion system component VasF
MSQTAPARRHSPNRQRLIARTALWSVAVCAVLLKVTLPGI